MYRYALLYGRFIVGTLSLHCSKYLPSTIASESNDAPQKSKDLFSKGKIYMEAPLSRGGGQRGGRESLNSSLYKLPTSLLDRPPIGHPWMDNESVKGSAFTSHNPQPILIPLFTFQLSCVEKRDHCHPNSWATTINNTLSTTHPAAAPLSPPPPGRCWTWPGSTSCSPPPTSASTLPSSPPQTWQSARHLLDLDPHTCKRESLIMLITAVVMFCM